MPRFSERYGHVPVRTALQIDDLDAATRTALWNVLYVELDRVLPDYGFHNSGFARELWTTYLSQTIDDLNSVGKNEIMAYLKGSLLKGPLPEIMDLIEFTGETTGSINLKNEVNKMFERFLVAYRVVGEQVVPVTTGAEVEAVEEALNKATPYAGAREHLDSALSLLADRQNPHYANSVKESISAVESMAQLMTGRKTLGAALGEMKRNGKEIHPALAEGWSKIFGYTSDADGIRHGSIDPGDVDEALATYFLVSCSAFLGLLIKAHEAS